MLTVLTGDALEQLRTLPDESVQCCVTSPPYWGLRDYSINGQLGLEKTPEEYAAKMVDVFREVRRVLRKDGTLWLNLGDSYASGTKGTGGTNSLSGGGTLRPNGRSQPQMDAQRMDYGSLPIKPKDLCGIPWRVAFALQADGWWLRSDIIWAKPNPMPESVTDRPTKSHEYLFLLTKASSYYYDAEAIVERPSGTEYDRTLRPRDRMNGTPSLLRGRHQIKAGAETRNKRSVWTVPTVAYADAHFATYPPDLIKPCIMAGTSAKGCCAKCGAPWERMVEKSGGTTGKSWHNHENDLARGQRGGDDCNMAADAWSRGDYKVETLGWQPTCNCKVETVPCTVLDPFAGSGTSGMVALELGRKAVLIELNPKYCELIRQRCDVTPGLQLA